MNHAAPVFLFLLFLALAVVFSLVPVRTGLNAVFMFAAFVVAATSAWYSLARRTPRQ